MHKILYAIRSSLFSPAPLLVVFDIIPTHNLAERTLTVHAQAKSLRSRCGNLLSSNCREAEFLGSKENASSFCKAAHH